MMNFQIQLTKKNDTLPMTRGYMAEAEKALWAADAAPAEKPAPKAERAPAPAHAKPRRRKVPGS
jgi:cyclopropane-fatty-acyl-phospholipid synthase